MAEAVTPRINEALADVLDALEGDDSLAGTRARDAISRALKAQHESDTATCHRLVDEALAAIDAMELP